MRTAPSLAMVLVLSGRASAAPAAAGAATAGAAGHLHLRLEAPPGTRLSLELRNLDNVWNGVPGSVAGEQQSHLARMAALEGLLRKHTWFTEGSTPPPLRTSGTLGEGWLERYDVDAVVHELNCSWIAGLEDHPSARRWQAYGASLARVLYEYFGAVAP